MDDDDDLITEETDEDEVEIVEASPWTNNDTIAALFKYAATMSSATSEFFESMNRLALGEAGRDAKTIDKIEFLTDADTMIKKLTEDDNG